MRFDIRWKVARRGSDATVGQKMIARKHYHRADTGAVCDGADPADPAEPADEDPAVADAGAAPPDTTTPIRVEQEQSSSVGAVVTAVATGDDATAGRHRGLEVYGDSGYGTGQARAAYANGGHTP